MKVGDLVFLMEGHIDDLNPGSGVTAASLIKNVIAPGGFPALTTLKIFQNSVRLDLMLNGVTNGGNDWPDGWESMTLQDLATALLP